MAMENVGSNVVSQGDESAVRRRPAQAQRSAQTRPQARGRRVVASTAGAQPHMPSRGGAIPPGMQALMAGSSRQRTSLEAQMQSALKGGLPPRGFGLEQGGHAFSSGRRIR